MLAVTAVAVGGDRQHRQLGAARQVAQRPAGGETVHHRHLAIQQDRIDRLTPQHLERLGAVVGGTHAVTQLEQHAAGHQLIDRVVLDHQHRALLGTARDRGRRPRHRRRLRGQRERQGQRHLQLETAALAGLRLMAETAALQVDQLPADCQADTQATVFAGHGAVQLLEALIQRRLLRHLEAHAGVDHLDAQRQAIGQRAGAPDPQADLTAGGELDGVVEQIAKALRQFAGIAFEGIGQAFVQFQDETQALVLGTRGVLRAQAVKQPAQAERLAPRIQLAGLQLAEGEDVVDHAHHVPRRTGGGLLVLRQLGVQAEGLHQFQRADHPVHRRAQLVGDGGEEFVLEPVTVGQLLVQRLQLAPAILENPRALLLHRVDPVGQGQRQQADLQGRTDLAGIHGQEHIGQVAEHHQAVDRAAEQEGAPGDDEVARHAHAAQPGEDPGDEDHHGEQQRQVGGQAQRQGIADGQRQDHHPGTAGHHQQQRAVDPGAVFGGMQEAARELAAEQRGRTDQEGRRGVRPPGVVGPEILDAGAVDRHLIEAERGDIEDVIEVAGIPDAEKDEQVVDQHHQQHAIDDAKHIDARGLLFQVGIGRPQAQRRLDRPLALQAQIDALRLLRLQVEFEQVVVVLDLPAREGQRVASALGQLEPALGVRQVQIQPIQRRIGQFQQPGLRPAQPVRPLWSILQIQAQPEHRTRITGIQHRFVMLAKTRLQGRRGDLVDGRIAADILEHLHGLTKRQHAGMFIEHHGRGA